MFTVFIFQHTESLERIHTIVNAFRQHLDSTDSKFFKSWSNEVSSDQGSNLIGKKSKKTPPVNSPDFPKWWNEVGKYQSPYRSELAR